MADPVIDLRSDTVTKPSPEMRRAMADAEVGDDVFIEDPAVNRLQERAAEIFRRPAALFVPSGTMGNLACIIAHTRPGQEVICEQTGHIYNYEMGSMSAVAGVLPRIVFGDDGILTWATISKAIRPKIYYRPQTALISLENTHNMAGGTVYPVDVADEICNKAHEAGIPVHLDGARIFNAAVYLDKHVAEITHRFDSVQFCLSKGLGAPVGSLIVGSKEFIERCRSIRKMLGGGMRQAGILAAAGLIALEKGPTRLHIDHANATILALRLAEIKGITLDCAKVKTNIVTFGVNKAGWSSADFLKALGKRNVLALPVDEDRVRMVTHQDVDRTGIERAAAAVGEVIRA
jgi:threonine aldolase